MLVQLNPNNNLDSQMTLIRCIKSTLERICNKANEKAANTAKQKSAKQKSTKSKN